MNPLRAFVVAGLAVLGRPSLWSTALVEFRRFVPDHWWRHRPHLPLPDAAVLRFRAVTQYGDPDRVPQADDVLIWLRWCKAENQRQRIR